MKLGRFGSTINRLGREGSGGVSRQSVWQECVLRSHTHYGHRAPKRESMGTNVWFTFDSLFRLSQFKSFQESVNCFHFCYDQFWKQAVVSCSVVMCYPAGTVKDTDTALISRHADLVPCENKCESSSFIAPRARVSRLNINYC